MGQISIKIFNNTINSNIIIIPRYESTYLKDEFPFAVVLEEKVVIQHLLSYADLFIGGGGTLNTEACFFNTPTISTRSFICHYDKYQIDNNLMYWVNTKEELLEKTYKLLSDKRNMQKNIFDNMNLDIPKIVNQILE